MKLSDLEKLKLENKAKERENKEGTMDEKDLKVEVPSELEKGTDIDIKENVSD